MSERIKYCIPFVDNHINIHCAIHADNSGISVKYMLISLLIKQYALNDHSYISYKYTTLATRQEDCENSIDSSNGCPLQHVESL